MIAFSSVVERTQLLDPGGQRAEQVIEHRIDPLTGTVASVNAALGEKAKAFLGAADVQLLRDLEERTRAGCPFCHAGEKGTRFAPEVAPEGQLRLGGAVAMPNLFSKCRLDAVVVLDEARHVLFPSRIGAEALASGIRLAAELVRRARAADPSAVHHVAGMNFLAPGGSSVPHPHFQVHARSVPYTGVTRAGQASAAFHARTGRGYWSALVARERELGARFIGASGSVAWLAAFAPAHEREIWGVLPGAGSLAEIGEREAVDFAEGLAKALASYEEAGAHAFTLVFISSPELGEGERFALHARLCARPAFRSLYANYDTWFTPLFLGDYVLTEAPEAWAARLRARW